MRRKDRPPTRQRPATAQQLDLFASPRGMHPSPAPAWEKLPKDAREMLTKLMARLLLDHGRGDRRPDSAGGGDRDA
jgi:hypothetical protein